MQGLDLPDVVLVRKSYEEKRRRRHARGGAQRAWTLRRMEGVEEGGADDAAAATAAPAKERGSGGRDARKGGMLAEQEQRDLERFLEVRCAALCCVQLAYPALVCGAS